MRDATPVLSRFGVFFLAWTSFVSVLEQVSREASWADAVLLMALETRIDKSLKINVRIFRLMGRREAAKKTRNERGSLLNLGTSPMKEVSSWPSVANENPGASPGPVWGLV